LSFWMLMIPLRPMVQELCLQVPASPVAWMLLRGGGAYRLSGHRRPQPHHLGPGRPWPGHGRPRPGHGRPRLLSS
jgi:hypothetical protein